MLDKLTTVLFVTAWMILSSAPFLHADVNKANGQTIAGGGGATVLVNQGFEGTGYDNGETWVESNTFDEDYTTAVKTGTHAGRSRPGTEQSTTITISDYTTYTIQYWFRCIGSVPSGTVCALRHSGGSLVQNNVGTSDGMRMYVDGAFTSETTDTLSADTWYRVQCKYTDTGTVSIEFNTTGTFDDSGTDYVSTTTTTTTDAVSFRLSHDSGGGNWAFDDVYVTGE